MKTQLLKGMALGLFMAITCSPLHAQTAGTTTQPAEPSASEEAGYGIGSVVANIFYMPAKITYAGLGLITGGLGYVLSAGNADVANNIIYPSIKGHYVVTPSHLKGTEPIYFVGAPPPETGPRADVPAAAATATR